MKSVAKMWLKTNGIASFAAADRRTALPWREKAKSDVGLGVREDGAGSIGATEWRNDAGQAAGVSPALTSESVGSGCPAQEPELASEGRAAAGLRGGPAKGSMSWAKIPGATGSSTP